MVQKTQVMGVPLCRKMGSEPSITTHLGGISHPKSWTGRFKRHLIGMWTAWHGELTHSHSMETAPPIAGDFLERSVIDCCGSHNITNHDERGITTRLPLSESSMGGCCWLWLVGCGWFNWLACSVSIHSWFDLLGDCSVIPTVVSFVVPWCSWEPVVRISSCLGHGHGSSSQY